MNRKKGAKFGVVSFAIEPSWFKKKQKTLNLDVIFFKFWCINENSVIERRCAASNLEKDESLGFLNLSRQK